MAVCKVVVLQISLPFAIRFRDRATANTTESNRGNREHTMTRVVLRDGQFVVRELCIFGDPQKAYS